MSAHLEPERVEGLATSQETDAHLDGCAECRERVRRAQGRQRLLGGLRASTLSDAGFGRVEAKLMEAIAQPVRAPWWRWPVLGAAAAGLAALVVWLQAGPAPVPVPPEPVAPRLALAPVAWPSLTVMRVEGAGTPKAGEVLAVGARVEAKRAHFAAASSRGLDVVLHGAARFGERVVLERGELEVDAAGERLLASEAGGVTVFASDAAYRALDEGTVELSRGVAWVAVGAGAPEQLEAPVRWSKGVRSALGRAVAVERLGDSPRALFGVAAVPGWEALELDGVAVALPFSGSLAQGPHTLTLRRGSASKVVTVQLDSAIAQWKAPVLEEREAPPPTEDAVLAFQRALASQKPRLAECYEKWLKATPDAQGEAVLELTVSARGTVTGVAVTAPGLPEGSKACLTRTAKKLVLPSLGSVQTVEVPLVLRPRGR